MSILAKGVKMPKNCHECEFVDILPTCPCSKMADEDFWKNVSLAVEGHKDCPLVPVPPHGRLIDADEFFDKIPPGDIEHDEKISRTGAIADVCTWVLSAPTIIEAEEV